VDNSNLYIVGVNLCIIKEYFRIISMVDSEVESTTRVR